MINLAHSALPAFHHTKSHQSRRQIGRPRRRLIREARATAATRIVAPGAIRRQTHEQVVQQDLRAVFHRQAREPIRAHALAGIATQPDQHIRKIDQPADPHPQIRTKQEQMSRAKSGRPLSGARPLTGTMPSIRRCHAAPLRSIRSNAPLQSILLIGFAVQRLLDLSRHKRRQVVDHFVDLLFGDAFSLSGGDAFSRQSLRQRVVAFGRSGRVDILGNPTFDEGQGSLTHHLLPCFISNISHRRI